MPPLCPPYLSCLESHPDFGSFWVPCSLLKENEACGQNVMLLCGVMEKELDWYPKAHLSSPVNHTIKCGSRSGSTIKMIIHVKWQ